MKYLNYRSIRENLKNLKENLPNSPPQPITSIKQNHDSNDLSLGNGEARG